MPDDIHILVLEDDDDLRESLTDVLSYEGYHVTAVGQGADAVEAARRHAFDLVVADIRMKGISGLDALEQMRGQQPELKSLVVTGYSTEADSIRAIRLGVGEYLKKPFDHDTFMDAVRRLVAQRREQQRARDREQALVRATLLALEALARSLDSGADDDARSIVGTARLAARLAAEVGLSPEAVDHTRLAALVCGLEERHPETRPGLLIEALSPSVRRIVRDVTDLRSESTEEQFPLDSCAAALARLAPDLDPAAPPQHIPEALLDALHAVTESPVTESPDPVPAPRRTDAGRRRRGLLSLAQALEGSGDADAAHHAYRDVLEDGEGSREGVDALLGLARLAHAARDADTARRMADHARALSLRFGPVAAAETSLEAALLSPMEHAQSLPDIARALDDLHLASAAARARLALDALCGVPQDTRDYDLTVLLQPENLHDLARSPWLLPSVLAAPSRSAPQDRALRRLVRDFPLEVERLLSRGDLPPAARAAAAQVAGARQAQQSPVLRIYSLGPFEVFRGDDRVAEKEWQGRNPRHILAYLAQAGRPVPVDVLLDHFWPDHLETGRKNLNWATSILRKCLRPGDHVIRAGESLQLNPEVPRWHDLTELDRELDALRQASSDPEVARGHARRALHLYRGPYLEDCYLDWALDLRNQTELRVLAAARTLARLSQSQGDHLEALETARRILELDPLDQDAWLLLLQSNLSLGRADEALRHFESCKRTLRSELGIAPSIDLLREHQRALLAL